MLVKVDATLELLSYCVALWACFYLEENNIYFNSAHV